MMDDMDQGEFVVRTSCDGTRFVATCRGEVDLTTAEELYDAVLLGVLSGRTHHIEVDLADVTLLSASGVRSLLSLASAAHDHGKPLELRMSASVRRVLGMVGLLN